MIYLHFYTIGDSEKQDIVTNIECEAIIPSIKNNFFHQRMVDYLNKLELSDQKYKNIRVLRDENDMVKLLFLMKGLCVTRNRSSVNVFNVKQIFKR